MCSKLWYLSIVMAELWALRDGLVLARNENVSNLCVELDSIAIVHL